MRRGSPSGSLLAPQSAELLRNEIDLIRFLERIASDELAG